MLQLGFSKYLLLSGEGPRWHPGWVCVRRTRGLLAMREAFCALPVLVPISWLCYHKMKIVKGAQDFSGSLLTMICEPTLFSKQKFNHQTDLEAQLYSIV